MMNKILINIGFWMMILLTACAISKKENERLEKIVSQQNSNATFNFDDSLTVDRLEYYEIHAIQKLEDFYEYLDLLSKEIYDDTVKNEIRFSAKELFYNPVVLIRPFDFETADYALSVDSCLFHPWNILQDNKIVLISVKVAQPLEHVDENLYVGQISFELKVEAGDKVISKKADFSLRKIVNNNGIDTISSWKIFLDKID